VTDVSPEAFIASIEDARRRKNAEVLLKWMTRITGLQPRMWGRGIIGFGRYACAYDSGHSGEICLTGFSPRKAKRVVYVRPGYTDISRKRARLGKHRTGKELPLHQHADGFGNDSARGYRARQPRACAQDL